MVQIAGHVTIADWGFLQLNADAARWVRSIKDDVRSRLMLRGEHSLWDTLAHYADHGHAERLHHGAGYVIRRPAARRAVGTGVAGASKTTTARRHDAGGGDHRSNVVLRAT